MITEEEIIQTLNEWEFGANLKNGEFIRGVKKEYYKDIAEAIVNKNLTMHDVSNLLLCGECDKETEHEELSSTTLKCLECGNIAVE